jgi:hypothetical protein
MDLILIEFIKATEYKETKKKQHNRAQMREREIIIEITVYVCFVFDHFRTIEKKREQEGETDND